MNKLRTIFRKLDSQIEARPLSSQGKLRFKHFSVLIALALPTMAAFSLYAFFQHNYPLFLIIIISGLSLSGGWFLIFKRYKPNRVYRINIMLFAALLLYMIVIGGTDGSKALWGFIFPLVVIFLMGVKEGFLWSVSLAAISAILMITVSEMLSYNYSAEYAVRFLFVYFIVTCIGLWLESSRVFYRNRMKKKQTQLAQTLNLFMSGPVVVFKWKNAPGWPVEYVSPNVMAVFGVSAKQLTSGGIKYAEIIHPEDSERVADEVKQGSIGDSFIHAPYRMVSQNKKTIWVADYTWILRDENKKITHYLGYVVDITAQMQAESRLREQHDFLRTLMNTIPNPIFFKDIKGLYLGGNKAFEKEMGRPLSDIIGKTVYDLSPDALADTYDAKDKELFNRPGRQTYEYKMMSSNGHPKYVIFNKSTFLNSEGDVAGIIGLITDITEHKKAESEKEALISELKQALEKIDTLSGFLPICSSCKKIRDDKGYWNRIETYIEDHSKALFSHSICPECSENLYGREDWYLERKKRKDTD